MNEREITIRAHEREAILIMFGTVWRHKYWSLDGKGGRPSIEDCVEMALKKRKAKKQPDIIIFLEVFLGCVRFMVSMSCCQVGRWCFCLLGLWRG